MLYSNANLIGASAIAGSNEIMGDSFSSGSNKTGLEDKGTAPTTPKTDWGALLNKGLDFGIGIFGGNKTPPPPPLPQRPIENEKILGMPKPVFYGSLGIVALITTVIVVKKMKK